MFTWYWLADLCAREDIPFVLGHALYMKAIHGGKTKNDKIDSHKIAVLLRGGMLPLAYVYPAGDARHPRPAPPPLHLVRKRAELSPTSRTPTASTTCPPFGKKLAYQRQPRRDVAEHFPDPSVRKSIEVDLALIDHYDRAAQRPGAAT